MDIEIEHKVRESWTWNNFTFTFEPVPDSLIFEKTETGYKVNYLTVDRTPMNPREDFEPLGTMVCFHGRYNLGDKNHPYRSSDFNGWGEFEEKIKEDNEIAVIYPIYMYDHSGVTISITPFNDYWDSGQIGFIYVTKEKVIKEFGDLSDSSIEKASDNLKAEVKTYDQYLSGDVYMTVVETYDESKRPVGFDVVGGYYGYEYAIGQLKET